MIEHGHTVMLGWSEQVFLTLAELAVANVSRGRTCVAILAEQDRVAMEEAIRDRLDLPGIYASCAAPETPPIR